MIDEGMRICRFNFSHGTHKVFKLLVRFINLESAKFSILTTILI